MKTKNIHECLVILTQISKEKLHQIIHEMAEEKEEKKRSSERNWLLRFRAIDPLTIIADQRHQSIKN